MSKLTRSFLFGRFLTPFRRDNFTALRRSAVHHGGHTQNTSLFDTFEDLSAVQTSPPGDITSLPVNKVHPQGNDRESTTDILQELREYLGKLCEYLPLSDSERKRQRAKDQGIILAVKIFFSKENDPDQKPPAEKVAIV